MYYMFNTGFRQNSHVEVVHTLSSAPCSSSRDLLRGRRWEDPWYGNTKCMSVNSPGRIARHALHVLCAYEFVFFLDGRLSQKNNVYGIYVAEIAGVHTLLDHEPSLETVELSIDLVPLEVCHNGFGL